MGGSGAGERKLPGIVILDAIFLTADLARRLSTATGARNQGLTMGAVAAVNTPDGSDRTGHQRQFAGSRLVPRTIGALACRSTFPPRFDRSARAFWHRTSTGQ